MCGVQRRTPGFSLQSFGCAKRIFAANLFALLLTFAYRDLLLCLATAIIRLREAQKAVGRKGL
jgi:hypothetical protein